MTEFEKIEKKYGIKFVDTIYIDHGDYLELEVKLFVQNVIMYGETRPKYEKLFAFSFEHPYSFKDLDNEVRMYLKSKKLTKKTEGIKMSIKTIEVIEVLGN